ncbi:MAG: hypothetical protein KBA43_02935 [Paludibacteraceae bacterium]|jgi:hypothetical protein|nr:hypothetical protein [Paludibacteraceae bacterium]
MTEILTLLIPALLVLLTAYLLLDRLLKNEEKRRGFELFKSNYAVITPIRLRAYERLMLVLERTTPNNLILNTLKSGMTNIELQSQLLNSIRQEFAHNLSQQIYVSDELWNYISAAHESLLRLINMCASQCQPNEPASLLAQKIVEVYAASEETPTEVAILKLKEEVRKYFQP